VNHILIVAHAPLASALRACALHVFPDAGACISALDVLPNEAAQDSVAQGRRLMAQSACENTLLLTDLGGATPSNVARQLADGLRSRLIAGVNLPMLLRALTYRHEALDKWAERALAGGEQGVMLLAPADVDSMK